MSRPLAHVTLFELRPHLVLARVGIDVFGVFIHESLRRSNFNRPTCSGLSPGGTHAYSSKAHPESSSEVELRWNPKDIFPIFPPVYGSMSGPRARGRSVLSLRSRFIAHER